MTNTEWSTRPHASVLAAMLDHAECVLFDFDGPICCLFAGHPAPDVARRLWKHLAAVRELPDTVSESADPHAVVQSAARALDRRQPRTRTILAELEDALTTEEVEAAAKARPTPWAGELVRALVQRNIRVAVTSNNSSRAIAAYLREHELFDEFEGHIYGRHPDLELMKPNPYCVNRAVFAFDVPAGSCLMLGDSPSDALAARKAGVEFLGYARRQDKKEALIAADAPHAVSDLSCLVELVENM